MITDSWQHPLGVHPDWGCAVTQWEANYCSEFLAVGATLHRNNFTPVLVVKLVHNFDLVCAQITPRSIKQNSWFRVDLLIYIEVTKHVVLRCCSWQCPQTTTEVSHCSGSPISVLRMPVDHFGSAFLRTEILLCVEHSLLGGFCLCRIWQQNPQLRRTS